MLDDEGPARASRPAGAGHVRISPYAQAAAVLILWWPLVLLSGLFGGAAAYGLSLVLPPSYIATSEIFVDPRSLQVLQQDLTARGEDSNAQINFVESQARIITSQSVLARVVEGEKLAQDPDFSGGTGAVWLPRLLAGMGFARKPPEDAAARSRAALSALYDRVSVHRPERTFVIDVSVRSGTAEKAARLANAVAAAYLSEQAESHAEAARRATAALTNRLDDLRERLRQSEQQAEDLRRRRGLVGTRTQLVSEQQLTDANTQLAQARARVIQARARFDQTRAVLAAKGIQADLPEAVLSPTIALLRGQQAEAKRRLADTQAELGSRHPSVRDSQAQVAGLDRAIGEELHRIAQSAKADLERAQASASAQQAVLDTLTQQASQASDSMVEVGALDREVDANRNLLNAFLTRARETGEIARVDTTNARVITVAQPPRDRASPPRGIVFLLLGMLGGVGASLSFGYASLTKRLTQAPQVAPPIAEEPARPVSAISVARSPVGRTA